MVSLNLCHGMGIRFVNSNLFLNDAITPCCILIDCHINLAKNNTLAILISDPDDLIIFHMVIESG